MRVPVELRRSPRLINHGPTTGAQTAPGSVVRAPLVERGMAWLECRVLPEPGPQQRYDLFVAEIVAAWADDGVFFTTSQRVEARRRS